MQLQIKIIIGTVAFMLTMIILGFVTLREPARMADFTEAFEGRSVENGAEVFANNCASCHGVDGTAQACFDPSSGDSVACKGRPLNYGPLVCGSKSQRMTELGWQGSKFDFIESTVSSGRPWNGMPTWGEQFGGPLTKNLVQDVVYFVLNWENSELCSQPTPTPVPWPAAVADLPEGDATRGEELYRVTYPCLGCHGDPAQEGSNLVGPWLGNIVEVGATRQDGYTAADYLYESVLKPNAVIAPDCPSGPCSSPSAMPATFAQQMSLQDMADIMAYLLGSPTFEGSATITYP